jgi:predicted nucleic acid-binding protein
VNVLVDTSVWSIALRRPIPSSAEVKGLRDLIDQGRAVLLGAIRQEILSGVRSEKQFELLRDHLAAFVDLEVSSDDHIRAAGFFNRCRREGVEGSNTDFLICAAAHRHQVPIFTTDRDFSRFAKILPVALFEHR